MKVYEQYYMDGPTRVFVEFFVEQPIDTINHTLPVGHVMEEVNLNRVKDVLGAIFLGISLSGLKLNTLKNNTVDEHRELLHDLMATGLQTDIDAAEQLEPMLNAYESFLLGPAHS